MDKGRLSLSARLSLVFFALFVIAIVFCGLLLFEQYRTAISGARVALESNARMSHVLGLRKVLNSLEGAVEASEETAALEATDNFKRELEAVRAETKAPQVMEILNRIDELFRKYVASTESPRDQAISGKSSLEEISVQLGALTELNENESNRTAETLITRQERSIKIALIYLSVFLVVMISSAYMTISLVTRPLQALADFVDSVDLDQEVPGKMPESVSSLPEVASLASSFDRLLARLREYQALNIKRLLLEKKRTDMVAATISDGICLLWGDEIIYANPVAERILEMNKIRPSPRSASEEGFLANGGERLTLRRLVDQVSRVAEGRERVGNPGAEAILEAVSRAIPVEYALQADDERQLHYLIQAMPVSEPDEEGIHLLRAAARPHSRVHPRVHPMTLVLAQDVTLVRESQEAKGHFLATLSHEIKTPVTSITLAIRLLARFTSDLPESLRNLVQTCVADVDRLRRLLDDLLTVSNFNTLTRRLQIQNVDLGKLIRHTVQTFKSTADERGVALNLVILSGNGESQIVAPVDPGKIAWALSNLITNALRHTPRSGRVDTVAQVFDDRVEIRVRDSGPGIDRSRQRRIFDKFSSYYDIRIARSGSTGTGLSIARELVVAHGGRIWVESEPGEGAEFCFTVPLQRRGNHSNGSGMAGQGPTEKGVSSGAFACS